MTELIITHQKEDPWRMVCPVCYGVLWELPDIDRPVSSDVSVREHHYTCDSCGQSFGWIEWMELEE